MRAGLLPFVLKAYWHKAGGSLDLWDMVAFLGWSMLLVGSGGGKGLEQTVIPF